MAWLDLQWLDNPVRSYLLVVAVIIVILLLKKYVSRPFALLLFHLVGKAWKSIDKVSFIELVVKPIGGFITILAAVAAVSNLRYPEAWQFDIYNTPFALIIERIFVTVIIISFIRMLVKTIDFTAFTLEKKAKLTDDKRDDQLIIFSKNLLKIILGIIGILLVIRVGFNRNISSLLTGLSIIGAALALAAKETIENLIASFIIFFDKPFTAGDIIKVNNINGTIEYIGLRSTRIRTNDKTLVTVPNKQMVDSIVDNWSARTERRGEIKLELHINTSKGRLEKLALLLQERLNSIPEITGSSVHFSEISKQGKVLTLEYFTAPFTADEFNSTRDRLNYAVAELLEEQKIEMAAGNNISIITDSGSQDARTREII